MQPSRVVQTLRSSRLLRRTGITLAVIAVLYTLLGFFALPPYAKRVAIDTLGARLGRPVAIESVSFNPFTLVAVVQGFAVLEPDGKSRLLAFDTLRLDGSITSLFRRAPVLDAIDLSQLRVNAVRDGENHYNFSDILARLAAEPPAPPSQEQPRFSLNNIRISGGRIDFDDRPAHAKHEVSAISLAIPIISNLPVHLDEFVQPAFSARVNGAAFKLEGQTKPFQDTLETHVVLNLDALDLAKYVGYVPADLGPRLDSGLLDAHLGFAFRHGKGKAPTITITGTAALRDVAISTAGEPMAKFARLDLELADVDPLGGRYDLRSVALRAPDVKLRRERNGALRGFVSGLASRDAAPSSSGAPLHVRISNLKLEGGIVDWQDEAAAAHIALGRVDVMAQAASPNGAAVLLDLAPNQPTQAHVEGLSVDVADLRLRGADATRELARIPVLQAGPIALDLVQRRVSVAEVRTERAALSLRRTKAGVLDIPFASVNMSPTAVENAPAGPPWTFTLDKLALAGYNFTLSDEAVGAQPQNVVLTRLDAQNLSNAAGAKAALKGQLTVGRKGSAVFASTLTLSPLTVASEVDVRRVDLTPAQPYIAQAVNLHLASGSASLRGKVNVRDEGRGLKLAFAGAGEVADFASVDTRNNEDLLKWKTLKLTDLRIESAPGSPPSVALAEAALDSFYSRIVVYPDGTLNVQTLSTDAQPPPATDGVSPAAPAAATAADAAKPAAQAPAPAPAKPAADAAQVRIDRVALSNGRINITDHFVKPNYSADLGDVAGSVVGLSSDNAGRGTIDLKARYDRTAPVIIQGTVNPLSGDLFLDLNASCKDVELPTLTAYAQKYAGYGITKGKLSLELSYHIEHRTLAAQNKVLLDQLTFGERVESPDATKLPVLLAAALLKNSRGEIEVNLPVSGSLDDPQFSVGGIIVKVIVNLLVKAATSPFALLGAAFGGGEEMSAVDFEPGRAMLTPAATAKLDNLGKALTDRPALRLDITGRVDPERDLEALRQYTLARKVKAVKRDELSAGGKEGDELDNVNVDATEYAKYLKLAYAKEKFAKPRNFIGVAKDLPVPEMEKLMLDSLALGETDLQSLALRRAERVKGYLLEHAGLAAERLFIVGAAQGEGAQKAARVDLSLK